MQTESPQYLSAVYEAIWRRLGASSEEAEVYASAFLNADLAGKDTQGIACIRLVYPRIRRGAIRFGGRPAVLHDGPSSAVIDGGRGPGQVVASQAMEIAIDKARRATIGCVWIRNTNVFTMASNYSSMALAHDFFGLVMCNGVPLVAPWGGRDPVFNTSPMSFAIPAGEERPIVFDGSMSSVSHGRVVLAARDGLRLAEKYLVDESGRHTDDPRPLVADPYDRNSDLRGAILPLGHKGFSWLILVEVLAGLMAGMSGSKDIPFDQSAEHPWQGGIFLLAINIGQLVPLERFKAGVDRLIRDIKSSRLAEGFDEIVIPGERARQETERRRRDGVPIRDQDWDYIRQVTSELGIDLQALRDRS